MSRSGYYSDLDSWSLIRWRGAVASAIRGERGQALLRDLRDALDALPEKQLIAEELITPDGACCALGAVARFRNIDVQDLDPEDRKGVAGVFKIAPALAAEIVYENDENGPPETPEERWQRMRYWVESLILKQGTL